MNAAAHIIEPTLNNPAASLTRDEILDLKRALTLLHTEMHNPGAARYIAQDVELDRLTDEMIYVLDHVLENLPNGRAA
jgi:hypothetical protein